MSDTAADRVAAFVAAFLSNETRHGFPSILTIAGEATNHKDMSLDANDVAELIGADSMLLREVAAALAALPTDDEEVRPDYASAEQKAAELSEDLLMGLVILFNQAGAVAYRAFSDKRRARNIAEMRAREEQNT